MSKVWIRLTAGWMMIFAVLMMVSAPHALCREETFVNFSFDQVDVASFAKLVGDITGRKFIVADDVAGKITVVSPRVSSAEVYPLFVTILESAGCSVIEEGEVFRVIKIADRQAPDAPVIGSDEETPSSGVITKVFRLQHVAAVDLKSMAESRVAGGKSGAVSVIEETNHLIITDTAESIRRMEKIVGEIDRPGLAKVTEVIPLRFIGASDLADQLNEAMFESESRGERLKRRLSGGGGASTRVETDTMVVAAPDSNSVILVGPPARLAELKRLIGKMDLDAPRGWSRLNAIFLKYIDAEEAAKSIAALLEKSATVDKNGKATIAIEASVANNALLVDASPGDFDVVKRLVDQLDTVRDQVHIEVLIAELSTTDDWNLGVEIAAVDMPAAIGETVIQGSSQFSEAADSVLNSIQQGLFPDGITIGAAHGSSTDDSGAIIPSYPFFINIDAVKKDTSLKILSETSLEAQNNREASVSVVNEIPILTSTIEGGSGTAKDVIQNIDRIDVGIKLNLTPHVIDGSVVQMELNPSIEAVIEGGSNSSELTPTIAKREVSTTVTVPDGETIIIAGLTRHDKSTSVEKVPILGSIPLLGWLFRHTVDAEEKRDLLIFVTPRIVTDITKAREVKTTWEDKTGLKANEQ